MNYKHITVKWGESGQKNPYQIIGEYLEKIANDPWHLKLSRRVLQKKIA